MHYKNGVLSINASVNKLELMDLNDMAVEALNYVISTNNLKTVKFIEFKGIVAFFKKDEIAALFSKNSEYEFKTIEHSRDLVELIYSVDEQLSEVLRSLSDCGISFNETKALEIISNKDKAKSIGLAIGMVKDEIDKIYNKLYNLRYKLKIKEGGAISRDLFRDSKVLQSELKILKKLER